MELHGAITTALPVTPTVPVFGIDTTVQHTGGICPLIVNGSTLFDEYTANKSNRGQNSPSDIY